MKTPKYETRGEGYQKLWGYFGLTYASFIIIPRSLMHQMPDEWQGKFADLMEEWQDTWNFEKIQDDLGFDETRASMLKDNKYVKVPDILRNYRNINISKIEEYKNNL